MAPEAPEASAAAGETEAVGVERETEARTDIGFESEEVEES